MRHKIKILVLDMEGAGMCVNTYSRCVCAAKRQRHTLWCHQLLRNQTILLILILTISVDMLDSVSILSHTWLISASVELVTRTVSEGLASR